MAITFPGEITSPYKPEVAGSGGTAVSQMGGLEKYGAMYDENGDIIADTNGINSQTQFVFGSATGSTSQTTSSTSYQNVTNLTASFTLSRTQSVLLFGQMGLKVDDPTSTDIAYGKVIIDSTIVGAEMSTPGVLKWTGTGYDWTYANLFTQNIISLGAGSHTLKIQFKSSGGDDVTINRAGSAVGYVLLGK